MVSLEGKKILITGASSGIGRAAAELLSELGAELVVCGRNEQRLEETLSLLKNPEKHIAIPFDVCDFDSYTDVFQRAVSGKKLTGLVHCAGIAKVTPLRMMKSSSVNELMNTNYTSFMLLAAEFCRKKNSCSGSIVGISAANAHVPQKCMSVYAASKAAMEASVRTLAVELAPRNVRINCVVAGAVDTPMAHGSDPAELEKITQAHLMGMSKPQDIAPYIAFLLSDAAAVTTGRVFWADGGMLGQY